MNTDPKSAGATSRRGAWTFSGRIFGRSWSLTLWHRGTANAPPLHDGAETDPEKKWQASLWVRSDAAQESIQEIVFYGQSLHSLRLRARDWLVCEQPQWFSNVSPSERLNRARRIQQVVVQRKTTQSGVGTHVPRMKARPPFNRSEVDDEPAITEEMAQRYPLVFPESKAAPPLTPRANGLSETPVADLPPGDVLYWSREEEGAERERAASSNGPNRFNQFEDAVVFFLWHDLLPERGPTFREEVFSSDVECYTRVNTIHQEENELLINDYLNRGWFYNGQVRGKVAPHRSTGDGPLIVLLYHREPLAR